MERNFEEIAHEYMIDNSPRVTLDNGEKTIKAARVEVGGDRNVEYWCPETYGRIDVPSCFVETDNNDYSDNAHLL